MDALKTLPARCQCGVYLKMNEHRDYYDTPAQRLEELDSRECPPEISAVVRAGILSSGKHRGASVLPEDACRVPRDRAPRYRRSLAAGAGLYWC